MSYKDIARSTRHGEYGVSDVFLERWSPRAMSGEKISREELLKLFEAARWAPSSSNEQPWRAVYALRDTPQWTKLFNLMVDGNRVWAERAAALVVFVARETFVKNGKPNRTHQFDTGSAWMSFALEGSLQGLVVHGMAGFDYDAAKKELHIPEGFVVVAMAAVGRHAPNDVLPEALRDREVPSQRKSLNEFISEGEFQLKQ